MTALVAALLAAYGTYLVWTAAAFGWQGFGPGPRVDAADDGWPTDRTGADGAAGRGDAHGSRRPGRTRWRTAPLTARLGMGDVHLTELLLTVAGLAGVGGLLAWVLFGGIVAPVVVGALGALVPVSAARRRRTRRMEVAREAWPRLIEEIRLSAGSLGRSLPTALVEVGRRAPDALRPAFAAAEREWFITTDFARTVGVLKDELADPTADMVGETLLVAHQLGGTDVDRRLEALAADRIVDLRQRRDARARQAGARFARRFVVGVPVGMAIAGLSIGDGRAAFAAPSGQVAVLVAIALMASCWVWAGRVMRLPEEERVLG